MIRSRLFWKLFLGFTLVSLLSTLALAYSTWRWQAQGVGKLSQSDLTAEATLLAELGPAWLADPASEKTTADLRRLAEAVGGQITLLGPGGETLAKGGTPPPPTGGGRTDSASRPITGPEGEALGSLRLTRSRAPLGEALASLRSLYGWYSIVALLLMMAVGYGVVAHLVGPVRALNVVADSMAKGDYTQRAFVTNRDELGLLAKAFNRVSQELGERLTALRESDGRQATVLGGMVEGVVAIDDRQHVLFANRAAGKLFDFLPPEVRGRPLLEVARNRSLHEAASVAVASRRPQRLDLDWDQSNLSVQVTPLPGDPAPGAVVVLHDTTELRRLESLRREFVANVSHELKTPLSSIKAYTETLLNGGADDPEFLARSLRRIEEQSERLDKLIADMLSLARIESARQPFDIGPVAPHEAAEACLRDHQPLAEAKQVRLGLAPCDTPAERDRLRVRADPEGLRVIFNNLIDNAVKYTPAGGEVRVDWRPEGDMVRIDVADTGVGIPGEKVTRVFERFYRVDESRSQPEGGAGLGLSIVKHLVQSFGGGVSVKSDPEKGTVFSVTLPAA